MRIVPREYDTFNADVTALTEHEEKRLGLLVLGMHRSGTSALTRVLSFMGCALPKTLIGANSSNPTGHWESDAIRAFNDELLALAGHDWKQWRSLDPSFFKSLPVKAMQRKAASVVDAEFGDSVLFVLKDPRISVLLPFWMNALSRMGVTPAIICTLRNPVEVARSLARRDGIEESVARLIWLRHVLESEAATRGMRREFTSYDRLMVDWQGVVAGISRTLGIDWPRTMATGQELVSQFLEVEMRHECAGRAEVLRDAGLPLWVREAYRILDGWAAAGEEPADYATLDAIRGEFDAASPLLAPLVAAADKAVVYLHQKQLAEQGLEAAQADAKLIHGELAQAQAQLQLAEANLGAINQETTNLRDQLASLGAERDEVVESLAAMDSRTRQRDEELSQVWSELEAARAEVQLQTAAAAAAADRTGQVELLLEQTRDALEKRLATVIADHRDARELDAIQFRARIKVVEEELGQALLARDKAEEHSSAVQAERDHLAGRLSEAHGELAQLARDQADLASRLADTEARLADNRSLAARARQIAVIVQGQPWWARLVARDGLLPRTKRRLVRESLIDVDAYLARYPDVAGGAQTALAHYLEHGMDEDRLPI